MFNFFKKKPPIWLDECGYKCQNCGVDFSAKEFLPFLENDSLLEWLYLYPSGKSTNLPDDTCKQVVICILCFRDYRREDKDEFMKDKMINLCERIHIEQNIVIPNGIPRDENGFFIRTKYWSENMMLGGRWYPELAKFEFMTNGNICLENAKTLTISKRSFSHLFSPEVKKIRAEYNNSRKIKLNEEKLKKLGSGIHTVTLSNGNKYIGELKDGKPHGKGTRSATSDSQTGVYTGEFRDGMPHGQGTYFLPEGSARKLGIDRWEGRFIDGEFQGDVLTGKAYRDE